MSFILDALKKSEAERQRQGAPGFSSVPDASARKTSHKWIWLVGILLGVNVIALMSVLYMANGGEDAAVTTLPVAQGSANQSSSSFSEIVAEAKRTQPDRSDATAGPAVSAQETTRGSSPTSNVSNSYSTFNELRAGGAFSLPDLHLDIHVYSGQPAERFVFINMAKYKESATLNEGPVVKQITPEGVVLGYQGTDFLLPRE
jgi:general secretion pathway protein B